METIHTSVKYVLNYSLSKVLWRYYSWYVVGSNHSPVKYIFSHLGHGCLKRHRGFHIEERLYTCVRCGKCFQQWSNLKKHQQIHNEKQLHTCDMFKISFTHKFIPKDMCCCTVSKTTKPLAYTIHPLWCSLGNCECTLWSIYNLGYLK